MEQSMSHHRDTNVPQRISAASQAEFDTQEEVIDIILKIASLTKEIDGQPGDHPDLADERAKLYNKKAKLVHNWKERFIKAWWKESYDQYLAGDYCAERDTTNLFDIYRKYLPERHRLSINLFKVSSLDSPNGRDCLRDMVALCKSTNRVAFYPGMEPALGLCPVCSKTISRYAFS